MKSYFQFLEDIQTRRQELHQKRIEDLNRNKETQAEIHHDSIMKRKEEAEDRYKKQRMKDEIKHELKQER